MLYYNRIAIQLLGMVANIFSNTRSRTYRLWSSL